MGIVDEASVVGQLPKPKEHIFLQEKAKWFRVCEDDGLARHNGFNEPFQNRFKEWVLEGCPRRADTPERDQWSEWSSFFSSIRSKRRRGVSIIGSSVPVVFVAPSYIPVEYRKPV